ncbi:MAG: hypothetical protein IIX31_06075, partial [Alistipes sp.]|nr:hypothetical protein [Alistipes sp.]
MKSLLATMAVVAVMVVMTLASCTTTADYTLGQELAPTNQQMTMRNRSYRGGVIREANRDDVPCKVFESRLFRTDSIKSTSLDMLFLGQHNDPARGHTIESYTPTGERGLKFKAKYGVVGMSVVLEEFI